MRPDPLLAEFESHQYLLLPHTARHLGARNLDVGCGSGAASLVHAAQLGISPTLCDVVDIRHSQARALPFRLMTAGVLPFAPRMFDSTYLQYVLHHVPGRQAIGALLNECVRVSLVVVIVEEVLGPNTDIERALAFDREVNDRLHPGTPMPVFGYLSAPEVKAQLSAATALPAAHTVVSIGSQENGWLETHVFVGRASETLAWRFGPQGAKSGT
jgi:ubiquinone/menaquinone biosynthesis C-methylase UbiE